MLNRNRIQTNPWGAIVGLAAWCLATLVGVWSGLEPDVILGRAVVAGLTVGLVTMILAKILMGLLVQENRRRK